MKIVVVNSSTLVGNRDFRKMVAAVQRQVSRDFCPAWGLQKITVKAGTTADAQGFDVGMVVIYDAPDDDALGYHTKENDRVFGKVFAKPVLDGGGVVDLDLNNDQTPSVASVLSHEVLELIADPSVNAWVDGPKIAQGSEYSYEVCDPVETDQYVIDGVAVSNFVYPSWFDDQTHASEQYDHLLKVVKPFAMTPGGYMVVRKGPGTEKEVFARAAGKDVRGKAVLFSKKVKTLRQKIRASHKFGRGSYRRSA